MVLTLPGSPVRRAWIANLLPAGWPAKPPTARRVAAWSAALVLHLVALAVLLSPPAPLAWQLPAAAAPLQATIVPRPVVEVVPLPARPLLRREVAPAPAPRLPVPLPLPLEPAPVALPLPSPLAARPQPSAAADLQLAIPEVGRAQAVAIESVTAPPYPAAAARRGLEGTVMLRVLIGVDGRASVVEVERGSGHRELDRAAERHVLRRWRFHPATDVNGRPQQAWARVPIRFTLDR